MLSMTGFGGSRRNVNGVEIVLEIKSYNNRFLDLNIVLSPDLSLIEGSLRQIAADMFIRGRIDISVRSSNSAKKVVFDPVLAEEWKKALENLSHTVGVKTRPTLEMLISCDGVFRIERDNYNESDWVTVKELFIEAAARVMSQRKMGGEVLLKDINAQLIVIMESVKSIEESLPECYEQIRNNYKQKISELIGEGSNESQIMFEAANRAMKSDINEEVVQLKGHIDSFKKQIPGDGVQGKKLDFFAQEMAREIGTAAAKISNKELRHYVMLIKCSIERIREQLRNVQ